MKKLDTAIDLYSLINYYGNEKVLEGLKYVYKKDTGKEWKFPKEKGEKDVILTVDNCRD